MKLGKIRFAGVVAGVLLGGLVAGAGCDGTDDAVASTSGEAELRGGLPFLHHRHPGHDAGSVGGAPGGGAGPVGSGGVGSPGNGPADGGASTDCDICTQAQACCNAVQSDRGCSFSAATCSALTGAARPAYVNACLTEVVSVRGAWSGNPPAECR